MDTITTILWKVTCKSHLMKVLSPCTSPRRSISSIDTFFKVVDCIMRKPLSCLTHYHTIATFNEPENLKKKPFENIVGKEENAGNQHFLLFLQCFLPFPPFFFLSNISLLPTNVSNLDQSKNLSFGKDLILYKSNLFLTLSQSSPGFYVSAVQVFWKY